MPQVPRATAPLKFCSLRRSSSRRSKIRNLVHQHTPRQSVQLSKEAIQPNDCPVDDGLSGTDFDIRRVACAEASFGSLNDRWNGSCPGTTATERAIQEKGDRGRLHIQQKLEFQEQVPRHGDQCQSLVQKNGTYGYLNLLIRVPAVPKSESLLFHLKLALPISRIETAGDTYRLAAKA